MKCKHCGGESFIGHQLVRMDILVDGDGDYVDGVHKDISYDITDSEAAYGPFQCCGCGAEYNALAKGEDSIDGPVEGWSWKEDSSYSREQLLDVIQSYARMIKRNKDYPTVLIDDLEKSIRHVLRANGKDVEGESA